MLWPGTELYYLSCQLESFARLPRQSLWGLKLPPALVIAFSMLQPHTQFKKKKSGYKQFLIACKILNSSAFGESDYADESTEMLIIVNHLNLFIVSIYSSSQPPALGLI